PKRWGAATDGAGSTTRDGSAQCFPGLRVSRDSVLLGAEVVLEHQAGGRGDDTHDADRDQPRLDEGQAEGRDRACGGQQDGPEAARREEAEVTGAVGDLRVLVVLRAQVQAAGDEAEVGADDQRQTRGQHDGGGARALDAGRRLRGEEAVDDRDDDEEHPQQFEDARFDPHVRSTPHSDSPDALSTERSVWNGLVEVATGRASTASRASALVLPARRSCRYRVNISGETARTSLFIIEW